MPFNLGTENCVFFCLCQDSGDPGILRPDHKLDGHRRRQVSELLVSVVGRDPSLSVELADNGRHVEKNVALLHVCVQRCHLRHVQPDAHW